MGPGLMSVSLGKEVVLIHAVCGFVDVVGSGSVRSPPTTRRVGTVPGRRALYVPHVSHWLKRWTRPLPVVHATAPAIEVTRVGMAVRAPTKSVAMDSPVDEALYT